MSQEELVEKIKELIEQRKAVAQEWVDARLNFAREYIDISANAFKATVAKVEAQADLNTGSNKELYREKINTIDKEIDFYLILLKQKGEGLVSVGSS